MRSEKKDPGAGAAEAASAPSSSSTSSESIMKTPAPAFLEKLFDILDEKSAYGHLISWQPDGTSFIIKKVHEFSEIVLPRYFKHSNIQSYVRQLNMYGFNKTRHDSTHREFAHKLFRRGRRDLLPLIKRKSQQTHSSAPLDSESASKVDFEALKVADQLLLEEREQLPSSSGSDRIAYLEGRLATLTSLYQTLAHKHNLLCAHLQTHSPLCYSDDDGVLEEHKPASESEPSTLVTASSPLSPFFSHYHHAGRELTRFPSTMQEDGQPSGESSDPSHSTPGAAAAAVASSLSSSHPLPNAEAEATKRPLPSAAPHAKRIKTNFLSFQARTDVFPAGSALSPLSSATESFPFFKKSFSVDLHGLDAIAVAADMLDQESSNIQSGKYLLGREGMPLRKSFSYG